jgi:Kef-type K+ transport system membrane component KefB/Trk K+ transport system NAD-binding subunit
MTDHTAFVSLLIITTLAAIVPAISARFKTFFIPVIILEILAGIIIGKSGLNIVSPDPILEFLAEFGFVFLMFISGLEVDFPSLTTRLATKEKRPFWKNALLLAFVSFGLTLAGAFLVSRKLNEMGLIEHPVIMGLILSTTSLGIVVPVLKERGIISNSYGQTIVLTALLADFMTLLLLSLAFGILRKGVLLEIVVFLALLTLFAVSIHAGIIARRSQALRQLSKISSATTQFRVRGSIALMVAWVALSRLLGTEIILGAFMAGVIVNVMAGRRDSSLRDKLDAMGFGFFIPIFFISVGAEFDLWALLGSWDILILIPIFVVAAYAVKVLPAVTYLLAFSPRESLAAGFLLSARLSLIIAASTLALELGAISPPMNAAIILLAAITCIVSPVLFNRLTPSPKEAERKGIIVVGMNHLTTPLAERLVAEGEEVNVLRCPGDQMTELHFTCAKVVSGNPEDEKALESLGAGQAAALVSALDDPEINYRVCQTAAKRFGIPVIASRADEPAAMERLRALGVRVVQPGLATVIALEGALRFPAAYDMLSRHTDNVEVGEAIIRNGYLDGLPVYALQLPGNTLIMGLRRDGDFIVPRGDTLLRIGDVVILVGRIEDVKEAKKSFRARI